VMHNNVAALLKCRLARFSDEVPIHDSVHFTSCGDYTAACPSSRLQTTTREISLMEFDAVSAVSMCRPKIAGVGCT
jgi:hypothetical protein